MRKVLAALAGAALCAGLGACTVTNTRMAEASAIGAPEPQSKILLVEPDVHLAVLTAAGLEEARADWSRAAHDDLVVDLRQALQARSHAVELLDPGQAMEGRTGQLLRLHDAVGQSILAFNYGVVHLPSKTGPFDWTLGEGAQALGRERGLRYALFVTGRGTYASAGRKAVMMGAALLGVGVPLGRQQVFASLVDLQTGRIVWFNVALAGPNADMRNPTGSHALVASLLKGAPL